MSGRRYRLALIRRMRTYLVAEIVELLAVGPHTVRRWIGEGLQPIDDGKPYVIHGSHLYAFLKQRQAWRKRPCGKGEFFCFGCRAPQAPLAGSVRIAPRNANTLTMTGLCSVCGIRMNRCGAAARLAEYQEEFGAQSLREQRLIEQGAALGNVDFPEMTKNDEIQSEE